MKRNELHEEEMEKNSKKRERGKMKKKKKIGDGGKYREEGKVGSRWNRKSKWGTEESHYEGN